MVLRRPPLTQVPQPWDNPESRRRRRGRRGQLDRLALRRLRTRHRQSPRHECHPSGKGRESVYDYRVRLTFDVRPEFNKNINKFLELRKRLFEEMAPALAELDKHPSSDEQGGDYALTERTCRRLATLLPEMRRHKVGDLSSGVLKTSLDAAAAERAGWFGVHPTTWMEVRGGTDSVFHVRAD